MDRALLAAVLALTRADITSVIPQSGQYNSIVAVIAADDGLTMMMKAVFHVRKR